MKIIKADNYQSWYIEYLDNSILIDPWLTKRLQPENSFFIQRHKNNESCLSKDDIKKVKAIIITAPFEDHLHPDSIKMLPKDTTIYTSNIVRKSLEKHKILNPVKILSESGISVINLNIKALPTSYPYYSSTFSLLIQDAEGNKVFHEGHRVNFKYLFKKNIKADVCILTAEESKLFGLIQLGMNYKNTIKASKILESNHLFITGNKPNHTRGFIGNFIKTRSYDLEKLSKNITVYYDEGDSYSFNGE
tara:strand:+ start:637 stop:1380 length:744 start_codon:yes stop_codon:yes gene_type:complete